MYDVIVIGTGPAGCIAAKKMAESGLAVLLVEKMELPRDKSCSGILIQKSIRILEKEFGRIPETVFSHPEINRGIILTNEDGNVSKFESEGYNVWRKSFDYWMALKAEEAGCELRTLTSAVTCEEKVDHVLVKFRDMKQTKENKKRSTGKNWKKVNNRHEKARMVIACDGTASIGRNLVNKPNNYIVTYQTFSKGTIDLESEFFYAFLNPYLSQYDAWFNMKDDYLIMGVGVKDSSLMKNYHSRFLNFLKSNYNAQIASFIKEEIGIIPEIKPGFQVNLGKGRVLFAGDAANFLNPLGEGISCALGSGYAAAEAIESENCKNPGIILERYKSNVKGEIDYMKRQWKFLSTISHRFANLAD